jgi:hypothetical protein
LLLEIKNLAELLGGKAGRNSLPLKKLLGEFFYDTSYTPNYYLAAILNGLYSKNRNPPNSQKKFASPGRKPRCRGRETSTNHNSKKEFVKCHISIPELSIRIPGQFQAHLS